MTQAALYLLGSNIISHLVRDARGIVAQRYRATLQSDAPGSMTTSIVVQCELEYGLAKHPSANLQKAYALQMAQLPVLPLDEAVVAH